ncbi:uncharacterized protein LOC123262675 [Cotesia glomerata]|nr:uncharacterized protein LOC123262675 [Cotesia glomerata]XP_044580946.1 uncharacterized protein LOC123262675 [Cotesia glomerata]
MRTFFITFFLTAFAFTKTSGQSSSDASSSSSASSSSHASSLTKAPILYDGPCPQITGVTLDYCKTAGVWYEVQRSVNNFDGEGCQILTWGKPTKGFSRIITTKISANSKSNSTTTAVVKANNQAQFFNYDFPTVGNFGKEYFPLTINYRRYAIVWGCENRGDKHIETAWIFARKPKKPCKIEALMRDAYAKYNLTVPEMYDHNLSLCIV